MIVYGVVHVANVDIESREMYFSNLAEAKRAAREEAASASEFYSPEEFSEHEVVRYTVGPLNNRRFLAALNDSEWALTREVVYTARVRGTREWVED